MNRVNPNDSEKFRFIRIGRISDYFGLTEFMRINSD